MGLRFEWDPRKNRANISKHGFGLERARRAFLAPMLSRIDGRRDYGDERWLGLGTTDGTVIVIAYTLRSDKVSIISARHANRHESQIYNTVFGEESPRR